MSAKSNFTNSLRSGDGSFRQNSYHEKLHYSSSNEEKIKFAGDESKDRLYEPKRNKKMMRVVTVVVYVFSVSLAAIMLSLYYVFFWNPKTPAYIIRKVDIGSTAGNRTAVKCAVTKDISVDLELTTPLPFPADKLYDDDEDSAADLFDSNEGTLIKPTDFVETNDTNIDPAIFENDGTKPNLFFKRIKEASRVESVKR